MPYHDTSRSARAGWPTVPAWQAPCLPGLEFSGSYCSISDPNMIHYGLNSRGGPGCAFGFFALRKGMHVSGQLDCVVMGRN